MARSHASPSHSPREKHAERPEKTSDSSRKSHHVRRKSGGPRDEKKKPALTRKTTPQLVKTSSGRRDRDRDRDDDTGRDRDRDGGESFPQFCMTCEKQFLPVNSTILYCSESCRLHDQAPSSARPQSFSTFPSISPPASPYYQHHHFPSDGPDIIPRFSPTQPRPRSYYHHSSADNTSYTAPSSYHPTLTSHFPPSAARTSASSRSSTALASLRDIAAALPRSPSQHPSPPRSPTTAAAGVWSFIPFSQSKTATPTPSATPGNSYGSPGIPHSQSYNVGGEYASAATAGDDLFAARRNSAYSVTYASGVGVGMDRPLPPRSGPGGYGNRGRNIDLVTPFGVGY